MKRLAAITAVLLLSAAPARATEWMICSDGGGKASISVLLGAMNVIAVNDIRIEVGNRKWSTAKGEGTLITRGQAFESAGQILIDVTDEGVDAIVAELRLFEASEGGNIATAGTLRMPGVGAWAVTCDGP